MNEQIKEVLRRAVLVVAYRGGDVDTEDGSFATTDVDEMIHLGTAIDEAFGCGTDGSCVDIMNQIEALECSLNG